MVAQFHFSRSDLCQAVLVYALLVVVFPGARTLSLYVGMLLGMLVIWLLWLASVQITIIVVYRVFAGGLWIAEACQTFVRRKAN